MYPYEKGALIRHMSQHRKLGNGPVPELSPHCRVRIMRSCSHHTHQHSSFDELRGHLCHKRQPGTLISPDYEVHRLCVRRRVASHRQKPACREYDGRIRAFRGLLYAAGVVALSSLCDYLPSPAVMQMPGWLSCAGTFEQGKRTKRHRGAQFGSWAFVLRHHRPEEGVSVCNPLGPGFNLACRFWTCSIFLR